MNSNLASFDFLCRVLSPFTESAIQSRLLKRISSNSIAWESVVAIANSHLVISALWVRLREKELDMAVEPYVRDYLQEIYALNLKRNHGLKCQTLEVIDTLNRKGIQPLLIKGASQLFQPVHGDMGSRIMTDIDMWVPEDRIPAAVDALTAIGYSDGGKCPSNNHHWPPLFRHGEYGAVELHREVLPEHIVQVLNASEICKTSEERTVQGVRYRTPTPTHALLLGMLHSQVKDRFHYEWIVGLKSLNDLVAMVSNYSGEIDWGEIERRMQRHELSPVLRTFLWSARQLFGLPLPTGVQPTLSTYVHHALCVAAIRWQAADRLTVKMDRYNRYIHRRFGGFENFFRYAAGRLSPI